MLPSVVVVVKLALCHDHADLLPLNWPHAIIAPRHTRTRSCPFWKGDQGRLGFLMPTRVGRCGFGGSREENMLGLGVPELIIILVIIIIVFGVGKLPQIGGALGKGIREFRQATNEPGEESEPSTMPEEESSDTS
jgi:sec-independent protein translocase protein TatA